MIDFGDVCTGDPSSDLGMFWLHFSPPAAAVAFESCGVMMGDSAWQRARGWALRYGLLAAGLGAAYPLGQVGRETLQLLRG